MTGLNTAGDGSKARESLETIRGTLRTQVAEILRLNITQLSTLPISAVYDRVLDTPQLLHECFQVFRLQPELFKRVIIRQDKRPATSDDDVLWCGRNVEDVVKLVVRASAKRHFRANLPGADMSLAPPPPAPPGLMTSTAIRLGLKKPEPIKPYVPPLGQGDKLYKAFREHLRFEWQVPLIPHYTPLEASTVTRLGSRILALREPGQLQILASEGLTPEGYLPLLLDNAKRLRGPDQGIDANALNEAFTKLGLGSIFPGVEDTALRRAVSQIACMDPRMVQMLMPVLEEDLKRVTIFLFSAFTRMGETAFRQAFGPHGAIWAVQKLMKHMETSCRPWPTSLPGMKQASERAIAFAIDLDTGLPAKDKLKTPDPAPAVRPTATAARPGQAKPTAVPAKKPVPAALSASGPDRAARTPMALSR